MLLLPIRFTCCSNVFCRLHAHPISSSNISSEYPRAHQNGEVKKAWNNHHAKHMTDSSKAELVIFSKELVMSNAKALLPRVNNATCGSLPQITPYDVHVRSGNQGRGSSNSCCSACGRGRKHD